MSAAPCGGAVAAGKVTVPPDRFPGLSPRAYALVVEGNSLAPRYAAGDVLVIDPDRIPKPGDSVVVYDGARIVEFATGEPLGIMHAVVGTYRETA